MSLLIAALLAVNEGGADKAARSAIITTHLVIPDASQTAYRGDELVMFSSESLAKHDFSS
jgi:hypothetical protein